MVVCLAGGTGGARLARGLLDVVEPGELAVIANPGDDVEVHGTLVCPDADLVTWWLADRIDARGWGLEGDTFHVMDGLRAFGGESWFALGDRDLAACLRRAELMAGGARLTEAHAALVAALGVRAAVLPACDEPVRTWVRAGGAWHPFQEFMVRLRAAGPVEGVEFRGAARATASPEVLDAIARAEAIVIGPSNPVISIGPILAVPGLRAALVASAAPVVAVSPLVAGRVVKGPTAAFLEWAGAALSSDGIAAQYAGVASALVADAPAAALPTHVCDVRLDTAERRSAVARAVLACARGLGS